MEVKNMPKNADFYCETCDFRCIKKSNFIIHTNTKKHTHRVSGNNLENAEMKTNAEYNCDCGKNYATLSGMWKHKAKGCSIKNANIEIKKDDPVITNNTTNKEEKIIRNISRNVVVEK